MSEKLYIQARKFITNKLMQRKQFILEVYHKAQVCPSKEELKKLVAGKFKCNTEEIVLFGFKTKFGGGKSQGICLIYDSKDSRINWEPKFRLLRDKLIEKTKKVGRVGKKQLKSKCKKLRGKAKVKTMNA